MLPVLHRCGAYKTLVDWYKKGDLDFSEVTTVNLDEYRGLTHSNDQSYYYFMNDNLFSHVNIDPAHTHIPDGTEPDAQKACDDFEAIVKNCGGTDRGFWVLVITGISALMSLQKISLNSLTVWI